jgi:integrase
MPKTHSVHEDVREFCGWPKLMEIVNRAKKGETKALIAALFLTGGRISEVLMLTRGNFTLSKDKKYLLIKGMPIVKRFRKVGEWIDDEGKRRKKTEKLTEYRTIPIPIKEPLTKILLDWVSRFKRKDQKIFNTTRVMAFYDIRKLGEDLYPHWFRAQRASQLASEYGFQEHQLMEFFAWKDYKTAMHYSRLGWKDLAKQMVPE